MAMSVSDLLASIALANYVQSLTLGDYVPLGDETSPPWFEQGIITEIHAQTFRYHVERYSSESFFVRDHDEGYFLCEGETFSPRLVWNRGEQFFARELAVTEAEHLVHLDDALHSSRARRSR